MSTTSTYIPTLDQEPIHQKRLIINGRIRDDTMFRRRYVHRDDVSRLPIAKQQVLLLHGPRQKYMLEPTHGIPALKSEDEVLVKILAIGLNPIDWKGPDYNFGLPSLPWINGRDFVGVVVRTFSENSNLRVGDVILTPSTDYRDIRKAAFQEYAVTTSFNAARVPSLCSIPAAAATGVAFVAASLALGVCFGLDFSMISGSCKGPNLSKILQQTDIDSLPEDIRPACRSCANLTTQVRPGDCIAIWGASTTTGYMILQLAKLLKLRVICVADIERHGAKLLEAGADLLVDRKDPERAIQIIRGVTKGKLRYALDIVGKDTATILEGALQQNNDSQLSHLLGVTGLPKTKSPNVAHHVVPIKLFHTTPLVGGRLMSWLETLLLHGSLAPPDTINAKGGLEGINEALEGMKAGTVSGKRVVVGLDKEVEYEFTSLPCSC
ncbi:putative secondary metabolism biosynthetic enzyme [Arachnomyces sp. PD_36]|nr:putative secondary metabolism biosynthetic enzyme [Arachnomyces sp. PD_36]